MATARAELIGVAELSRKLAQLGDAKENAKVLKASIRAGLLQARKVARANARAFSPGERETHRLHNGRLVPAGYAAKSLSMSVFVPRQGGKVIGRLGVKSDAFYAVQFFELGTSRIAARPWLVPAFESSQDAMLQGIGRQMRQRIDRIAAKRAAEGRG